jgi:hypothetical protein
LGIFSNFGDRFFAVEQQLSNLSSETNSSRTSSSALQTTSTAFSAKKRNTIADGWQFKQQDQNDLVSGFRPVAILPTNIHLDLLSHNIIPDPFAGTNESEVQWVGETSWVYRCSCTVPLMQLDNFQYASLIFEGLDNLCNVK